MRQFPTAAAPHLPARGSVRGVMARVLLALVPGTAVQTYWFGPGVLLQVALAVLFALLFEALMLRLRGEPLQPALSDLSAPLTGWLFALSLPPLAPWWIAALGMAAAIVFAKQLYGGLGYNLFNPAMVGFVVVLVSFPLPLSQWPAPDPEGGWMPALDTVLYQQAPDPGWDTLAQATPLDTQRQLRASGLSRSEIEADAGYAAGTTAWAWIAFAHALGGLALLLWRVADWRTPAAVLGTVVVLTVPAWLSDPDLHPSPLAHIATGALVFAAFFIATDPVTGCTTPRGRWLFGAGVAALTLAIRRWGNYPDGVAFAVLLMNAAAPWLDLHTRPRIFGQRR